MESIQDKIKQMDARIRKIEAQIVSAMKIDAYIHPMTRRALIEHAPEMTQEEMDHVVSKYWSIGQQYANAKEYAMRRSEVLDASSVAKAARELFWLRRAKIIEYLKPMKIYTII